MSKQFLYRKQDGINRYYEKRLPTNMIEELNLSYIGEKDIDFGSERLSVSTLFKQNFRNTQQAYRWFTIYFKKNNTNQYMKNHASYIKKEYYYNEHLAPSYFEYLMKHDEFQVIDWKCTIKKDLSIEGYWLICKKETNLKDIDIISDKLSKLNILQAPRFYFHYIDHWIHDICIINDELYYKTGNNKFYKLSESFINWLQYYGKTRSYGLKYKNWCNKSKGNFSYNWIENKLRNIIESKLHITWNNSQKRIIEIIFRNMLQKEKVIIPEDLLQIYIQTQFKLVDNKIKLQKEQQLKEIPF